jgi:hypothetical protein
MHHKQEIIPIPVHILLRKTKVFWASKMFGSIPFNLASSNNWRRKLQEDKGFFKHEPTSNVDYNQDIEMEMEIEMKGLDGDEVEVVKMMALPGISVPDDTWSLTRGYDYDWSKPSYPRNPELWKTAKTFLAEALEKSGTNVPKVYIRMRKVDEEVLHYTILDATASQSTVLYKVCHMHLVTVK